MCVGGGGCIDAHTSVGHARVTGMGEEGSEGRGGMRSGRGEKKGNGGIEGARRRE